MTSFLNDVRRLKTSLNLVLEKIAMKNIRKQWVIFTEIFALFFLSLPVALADSGGFTGKSNELGCIVREPGAAKFLQNDSADIRMIGEAAVNAWLSWGRKVIDPCLTRQVKNIPAAAYSVLAEKYPEKFQPFKIDRQNIGSIKNEAWVRHQAKRWPTYNYFRFDETILPGFFFAPAAIIDNNDLYGNAWMESEETFTNYVAIFKSETLTLLQEGFASTANKRGTIGGFVLTDPENFLGQAALFHKNKTQLIPRLPEEIHSEVIQINDTGAALIFSFDTDFNGTVALYEKGQLRPLDFGPEIPFVFFLNMNNQGIISGTTFIDGLGYRGFRFDPKTGLATLLHPLSTEPDAWALDINNRGDILGYSFVSGGIERIGLWNKRGKFHTYFVEGTPEFPTISNFLRFNDNNLIVITSVSSPVNERNNSYLVPKPGIRVNLTDLIKNLPAESDSLRWNISDINDQGNMIGYTVTPDFLSYPLLLKHPDIRSNRYLQP